MKIRRSGVEIRLRLEPALAGRPDIGAVLLARVARLFLNTQRWRRKNRCTVEGAKRRPCSRSRRTAISASVMSGVSSSMAKIAPPSSSIRHDRLSPPCSLGATDPVSRQSRCHFTAADSATPNRAAADR